MRIFNRLCVVWYSIVILTMLFKIEVSTFEGIIMLGMAVGVSLFWNEISKEKEK